MFIAFLFIYFKIWNRKFELVSSTSQSNSYITALQKPLES